MDKIFTVGDLLTVLRGGAYSRQDEGQQVMICPECEEFTHVVFNVYSGLLDRLGDLIVTTVDADADYVRMWVKTGKFDEPVGKYDTRLETRVELVTGGDHDALD